MSRKDGRGSARPVGSGWEREGGGKGLEPIRARINRTVFVSGPLQELQPLKLFRFGDLGCRRSDRSVEEAETVFSVNEGTSLVSGPPKSQEDRVGVEPGGIVPSGRVGNRRTVGIHEGKGLSGVFSTIFCFDGVKTVVTEVSGA